MINTVTEGCYSTLEYDEDDVFEEELRYRLSSDDWLETYLDEDQRILLVNMAGDSMSDFRLRGSLLDWKDWQSVTAKSALASSILEDVERYVRNNLANDDWFWNENYHSFVDEVDYQLDQHTDTHGKTFHAVGRNLDWRGSSGEKDVRIESYDDIRTKIVGNIDARIKIELYTNGIIDVTWYHHDCPTGSVCSLSPTKEEVNDEED